MNRECIEKTEKYAFPKPPSWDDTLVTRWLAKTDDLFLSDNYIDSSISLDTSYASKGSRRITSGELNEKLNVMLSILSTQIASKADVYSSKDELIAHHNEKVQQILAQGRVLQERIESIKEENAQIRSILQGTYTSKKLILISGLSFWACILSLVCSVWLENAPLHPLLAIAGGIGSGSLLFLGLWRHNNESS
jgi:hypothetical protein